MRRMLLVFVLSWMVFGGAACAAEVAGVPAPVGQWRLDGDAGDSSGRNHHGAVSGATFVPRGEGRAMSFDGEDGVVTIATHPDLSIGASGTLVMWVRPEARRGALFSFGAETESSDHNFTLVFDTRRDWGEPGGEVRLYAGGSRRYQTYSTELPDLPLGRWTQVAACVNGTTLDFYYDAEPVMQVTLPFVMDLTDRPLSLGRYRWSGEDVLLGQIDEVTVYNRPLSQGQVLDLYRGQYESFGHDASLLARAQLEIHPLTEAGRIDVRVRAGRMAGRGGEMVRVTVSGTALSAAAPFDPSGRPMRLSLDTANLPAGNYEIQCEILDIGDKVVGEPALVSVSWPGRDPAFNGIRVLNNLVWELLNERPGEIGERREYRFTQPKHRWTYVRAEGTGFMVTVDGAEVPLPEAMLFLSPGEHALVIAPTSGDASGGVKPRAAALVVRSIPQLIFDSMIPEPHVQSAIPFDEDFIRKHIVPHVNTFTVVQSTRKPRPEQPLFREILASGRHILGHCLVPTKIDQTGRLRWGLRDEGEPMTVDAVAEFIGNTWGMTRSDLHGSIADEFGTSEVHCAVYAEALRRLHADPRFAGRQYVPYVGRLYTGEPGRELVRALMDTGSAFTVKHYLPCPATEQAARDAIRRSFIHRARKYHEHIPGSIANMIVCFGYFCTPNEFLNVVPQANYKNFLDMQFHLVATEPEFWATRGLHNYLVHYADEETSRWIAHLYRHYGIEGSSKPAATDPFDSSRHLANGDFDQGTNHWRVQPAAPGCISVIDEIHFGWLQGRYPYTPGGDSALCMVRHADRPNVAAQTVRNLQPGRLYAARMISAVHGDMTSPQKHALRLEVPGATVLPEQSFTQVFGNSYAHSYGGYDTNRRAWMTYHWLLFRAEAEQAELTISDWTDANSPGGPVGEPLIMNFVQVHPYFSSDDVQ